MIMLCNYDAKEWNKKWVTEQIDVGRGVRLVGGGK
jgi:hypothetical protein